MLIHLLFRLPPILLRLFLRLPRRMLFGNLFADRLPFSKEPLPFSANVGIGSFRSAFESDSVQLGPNESYEFAIFRSGEVARQTKSKKMLQEVPFEEPGELLLKRSSVKKSSVRSLVKTL